MRDEKEKRADFLPEEGEISKSPEEHAHFSKKIAIGLAQADAGVYVSHDEVKRRMRFWLEST